MSSPKITFISASAGSGKTYRVVEEVHRRLKNGSCRPGGLIATTFTVKAAGELKDRLREKLYGDGQGILAERLSEAAIGTVDSVCAQLLQRFAFEVGISPEIKIDEDPSALLSMAIESAADSELIQRLLSIATMLSQKTREGTFIWREDVSRLIALAQANDFSPDDLPKMASKSSSELISLLPPRTADDLDAALGTALSQALQQISHNGDMTGVTARYRDFLKTSQQRLAGGELSWVDWLKLANSEPGAKSRAAASNVSALAMRYESHPRFQQQLKEYIEMLFNLAQRSMVHFAQFKRERGLMDFPDLEQLAYHLLRNNPQILAQLKEELDLLVVDEFQDTSPLQLALFLQLAECAKEVVWVGDVKQAIYGFRNSDPELIDAVIAHVKETGGLAEPLGTSYRSLPDLVKLANQLFMQAFARSLSLPENQVRLEPCAEALKQRPPQPAIQFLEMSSGQYYKGNGSLKRLTLEQYWTTLAEQIAQWFSTERRLQVRDRANNLWRPLELRDVAVLCRKNDDVAMVAEKLGGHGLSVKVERGGSWQRLRPALP